MPSSERDGRTPRCESRTNIRREGVLVGDGRRAGGEGGVARGRRGRTKGDGVEDRGIEIFGGRIDGRIEIWRGART